MSDARVEAAAKALLVAGFFDGTSYEDVPIAEILPEPRARYAGLAPRVRRAAANAIAAADAAALASADELVKGLENTARHIVILLAVRDDEVIKKLQGMLREAAAALAGLAGQNARLRECITVIEARATGREAAGGTRVDYQDCLRGCGEIARAALQEKPDAT